MCLPLTGLVGLGWRLARVQRDNAKQSLAEIMALRLDDIARPIERYVAEQQRRLDALVPSPAVDASTLRNLIRRTPGVRQIFVLGNDGRLMHPDPLGPLSESEQAFLNDFADMFLDGTIRPPSIEGGHDATMINHWVQRFSGLGMHVIYCQHRMSGQCVGIVLERSRVIADLIALLPDGGDSTSRIRLVGARGQVLYEWGEFDPQPDHTPTQEKTLPTPLEGWRLQHFMSSQELDGTRFFAFQMWTVTLLAALVVAVAGAWFYREYRRYMRNAMQKVSFVNQVSHELKTPLTNIRMYAELLEQDLDDMGTQEHGKAAEHLKVVVDESQRLSRLIGNVLTLAQSQRQPQPLRSRPAIIDEIITTTLAHFKPALDRKGMTVSLNTHTPDIVSVDQDVVEQIVGNLLSNVEKYGNVDGQVNITAERADDTTTITVHDDGPGIPASQRERIFTPFARLSNDIAAAPGTGIGLTIARDLARRHGGDLVAVPAHTGACFKLTLHTPAGGLS